MISKWHKRLNDLRQLILQAEETYFDPNLFRLNINNAIQTSRTITFIIQKEKANIPEFENWYKNHVLIPFNDDLIMGWLKDARNVIEKEGDLNVNSFWRAYHLYSYTNLGQEIVSNEQNSLFFDLPSFRKQVKKSVPAGIFKDSALAIDRSWIANTLPGHELIDAVSYGYRMLAKIVDQLDSYLGIAPVCESRTNDIFFPSQTKRAYIKLNDSKWYKATSRQLLLKPTEKILDRYGSDQLANLRTTFDTTKSLAEKVEALASVACNVFKTDGHHISICFLVGESPSEIRMLPVVFSDHIDKLIFWYDIAYCVRLLGFTTVLFVSEAWLRSGNGLGNRRISELKIMGELLHVVGASKQGEVKVMRYSINRNGDNVTLSILSQNDPQNETVNFLTPIRKEWGVV